MMLKIEARKKRSNFLEVSAPVIAVFLTMIFGGVLFLSMGKNPFEAIKLIFWDPIMSPTFSEYSTPQLVIKAAPLILIAGIRMILEMGLQIINFHCFQSYQQITRKFQKNYNLHTENTASRYFHVCFWYFSEFFG